MCQELKSEIRSLDDLFEKLTGAPIHPKAEVEHFLYTWDWKSFISDKLTKKELENHSYYHQFQFVKESELVRMRAKHLPQDADWTPTSGLRLVRESVVYEPVPASEFRIEKLDLEHVFRDLLKYFQTLPLPLRMKVSSSWDFLRETLEKLPSKQLNLEKMKILDLPKQASVVSPTIPDEFSQIEEVEIPPLKGDIFPEDIEDGRIEDEIFEGLDVVCYTVSKSKRPWVGRVTEVLPGGKFKINWYIRKKGDLNTFYAMKLRGQPFLSVQENACVILWGFSEQKDQNSFVISNYWLAKIKCEYENYDKNEMQS